MGVALVRRIALTIARHLESNSRKICWSSSASSEAGLPDEALVIHSTVAGPAICTLAKVNFRFSISHRNGFQARQARAEGSKAESSPESRALSIDAPNAERLASHSASSTVQTPSESKRSPGS